MKQNYIDEVFYQYDALLEDVLSSIAENGMPAIFCVSIIRKAVDDACIDY